MADASVSAGESPPAAPRHNYDTIPAELKVRPNWVVWKQERRNGKWTKVPYRVSDALTPASTTDPKTWGSFEQALTHLAQVQGVGYVFSVDDPYVGADFDKCIGKDGELHPAAADLLIAFGGYQERSPSGVGMHAVFRGELTGDRHRTSKTPWGGEFEIYDQGRYFTFTGQGGGDVEHQPPLNELVEQILGKPDEKARSESLPRTVEELIAQFPKIGHLLRHEGREDAEKWSQSQWDMALAWECARRELTEAEYGLLLRQARGDKKATRKDYVEKTWAKAYRGAAFEDVDPAVRISRRYNLRGDDRIVRGDPLTDVASGAAKVYLWTAGGRRLRFPRLGDLFEAGKHTRIASQVTRSHFGALTGKEAVDVAQAIIELCGGEDADPLGEARECALEFIAHAGATVEWIVNKVRKSRWEVFSEHQITEQGLTSGRDPARRSAIIYDAGEDETWLPAQALRDYSGSQRSGTDFISDMGEAGWRHVPVDLRGPGGRAERANGEVGRVHRNFYVGKDEGKADDA